MSANDPCPVCRTATAFPFAALAGKTYLQCTTCRATWLNPDERLDRSREFNHYTLHRNDPDDPRYRAFLSKLATPLLDRLSPSSEVLDFGCGPGPALAAMMREAGHRVAVYDPFFAPDAAVLTRAYDAITCSEVAEHFRDPAGEFDRMGAMLRPGGWLALMTCFQTDDARFAAWHYRLDPTHVVFYREETLRFVARQRGWSCECPAKDVALMQRRPEATLAHPRHG